MIAMLKTDRIEKEAQHFSEELWIASVIAKAENDMGPALEGRIAASADAFVESFLKEAKSAPCYELIRQVDQRSWAPKIRVKNSFGLMARASGRSADRGIIPLIGMRRKDLHLVPEEEKDSLTGKTPAKNEVEAVARAAEHIAEMAEAERGLLLVRGALAASEMPQLVKAHTFGDVSSGAETAFFTLAFVYQILAKK